MKAFVFDTETTGLIENSVRPLEYQPRIIQLYGIVIDLITGEELSVVEGFYNPGHKLEKEIVEITGITDEMLKDKEPFSVDDCHSLANSMNDSDCVIAHNLAYDWAICGFEFQRNGLCIENEVKVIQKTCTVEETEWIKGFRLSLSALYEHLFDETFDGAHRADNDVRALARCCVELFAKGMI
jgi:DNA polymerase III epsilon subunit-like protein